MTQQFAIFGCTGNRVTPAVRLPKHTKSLRALFTKCCVGILGSTLILPSQSIGQERNIYATTYDYWYEGRTTACGNAYQHWGISAASGSLPCGTRVRLSYRGRSLTVPIRDACECSIDLSAGAAAALGVNGSAVVRISY